MSEPPPFDWPAGKHWQGRLLIAGLIGVALCGLAAFLDVEQFLRSYLFAYFSWLGIALGSLALWMLHYLTGGAWGLVLRRTWEAASRTLLLMAGLFVPIALGAPLLFPWAEMDAHELGVKTLYLNVPFFLARALAYFVVWLTLAFLLNRWSAQHDRTGEPRFVQRAQQLSGPGLPICGLCVTFAAIDWVMSLEPEWYSSIFGALVAARYLLAALAFAIGMATWLPTNDDKDIWNDLGNLLLAFVMIWAYLSFSQYLLIWSGNLPEEITWYLRRTEGGWYGISLSLAIGYFALPFCLLLSPEIKRNPDWLRLVALFVVAMSIVHDFWLIAPAFSPGQFHLHWMDPVALLAVGGLWLAWFLRELQARPIMPVHEALAEEELHHA